MSLIKTPLDKGITAHAAVLNTKDKAGAHKKRTVSVDVGNVVSLVNNFKPSAKGCNKPI